MRESWCQPRGPASTSACGRPVAATLRYARTSPYLVTEGKGYDGGYHYRGRADTFYKIGVSFGSAMLEIIKTTPTVNAEAVQAAGKQARAKYGF